MFIANSRKLAMEIRVVYMRWEPRHKTCWRCVVRSLRQCSMCMQRVYISREAARKAICSLSFHWQRPIAIKETILSPHVGEHPSIDSALAYLQEDGFTITKIPFTEQGLVDLQLFEKALTSDTILVSIQHINPEIGTIQPLEKIAAIDKRTLYFAS